jgi:hypothetical protein
VHCKQRGHMENLPTEHDQTNRQTELMSVFKLGRAA